MSTSDVCSDLDTCEDPSPVSHSNLSRLWLRILANWATAVIFLLLSPVVTYLISQVFGVRATQFLLRLRSSTLFEWVLLFVTFALGTVFLVLHELRVSSGVPYFLKWVASWLGEADAGVGWQQLVFPLCLAIRAVHLFVDFFRPNLHAVLVWLGLLRHDVADSLEPRTPRSRLWWVLALDIVLLSGNAVALLLIFPWSDSALREEFQLSETQWRDRALFTLTVRLLLSFLLWWFVPVVTWSPLHHQAPCDGANGVTHVDVCNLRMAGLDADALPVFLRQEAIGQYNWLQIFIEGQHHVDTSRGRVEARVAHIEGPPGTGKSTITWAWACELARQQPVVWAHHSAAVEDTITTVALLGSGCVASLEFRGDASTVVFGLAQWAGAHVVVVDGVKKNRAQVAAVGWHWAGQDPLRRKLVTVASAQLAIDGLTEGRHAITFREVFSWANSDYAAACQAPGGNRFWQHVKGNLGWQPPANGQHRTPQEEQHYKATLLDERFFLAGASARWMFAFTTARLRREIDVVVHRVQNAGSAVGQLEGMRARDAVNKAYARFPSVFGPDEPSVQCLVSGRVTRLLGDRCDLNFITTATQHNLPAGTDGTVFELDFRHHIKQAAQHGHGNNFVTVYAHGGQQCRGLRLRVARVFEFRSVADLAVLDIVDGAWFLPLDDCNGGYDFAFYHDGCLFTLQVTKELPSHSEKWCYMNELAEVVHGRLTALARPGLQFVEHIYVVPVPNVDGFQAPAGGRVEGNPYWLDTHRRIVSFQRAGGAGPVNVVGTADIKSASREAQGRNGGLVPLQIVRGRQLNRAASARSVGNVPW